MRTQESLPVEAEAQQSLSAAWEQVVRDGPSAFPLDVPVRSTVRASWTRALERGVHPTLPRAPQLLDDHELARLRDEVDWLPQAEQVVRGHARSAILDGHILALFDDRARMLAATGDPRALDGLADINFRPGALWSEEAVGTNGPGTALATGRAVHIVGAEHFCSRWQGWHCAAAPVRDPLTHEVIGVLDLSGFRERAHPHTLSLATAIAVALEQRLAAREAERRVTLLRQFGALVGKYASDAIVVVDRAGEIIASSAAAERLVRRLQASGEEAIHALRQLGTAGGAVGAARWEAPTHGTIREASHPLIGGLATIHAMHDGRTPIGACLVLPASAGRRTTAAAAPGTPPPAVRSPMTETVPRPAVVSGGGSPQTRYGLESLRGDAPVLDDVRRFARACARTDLPVLLLGESGTGKEVVAQGIHAASPRHDAPFVAVNCAALPRDLIESELFGHVAGAFSGARRDGAMGKFEAAHGGTLFLDEIGELPPAAQASLLRVLQEGEVTPLGATAGRVVDVRIVAATNRDIPAAIASGLLRDDLYHRLNVLTLSLPPLRARTGDAVLLAKHFLAGVRGTLAREFSPEVLHAFACYRWPGNVRELENLVKRLAALAEGPLITEELLPAALREATDPRGLARHPGGATSVATPHSPPAPSAIPRWWTLEPATGVTEDGEEAHSGDHALPSATPISAHDAVRTELRARYASLVAAHATMQEAAAAIGITRSTLYRRLQRLGLAPGRGVRHTH